MRRVAQQDTAPVGDKSTLHAVIEYLCTAHPHPSEDGPRYSIVDGAWAFCAGHGYDEHEWTRIEPTRPGFLGTVNEPPPPKTGAG